MSIESRISSLEKGRLTNWGEVAAWATFFTVLAGGTLGVIRMEFSDLKAEIGQLGVNQATITEQIRSLERDNYGVRSAYLRK